MGWAVVMVSVVVVVEAVAAVVGWVVGASAKGVEVALAGLDAVVAAPLIDPSLELHPAAAKASAISTHSSDLVFGRFAVRPFTLSPITPP